MTAALLLAVAAVVGAPLIGYVTASRRLSGKIGTTDADALWAASESMRKDYREQLDFSNKRVVALEERVGVVERDNNGLVRENIELSAKVREYEATIAAMQVRLDEQAATIETLRKLVITLQENGRKES